MKNLQYKLKYKDIQKIAEYWVNKQGIRSSRQLREFIINKGNWELNELAINLNISQEYAMILLESLGYELRIINLYLVILKKRFEGERFGKKEKNYNSKFNT